MSVPPPPCPPPHFGNHYAYQHFCPPPPPTKKSFPRPWCDGPIVGGNNKICNTIVRHSHNGLVSAEILSVGPMVISMNRPICLGLGPYIGLHTTHYFPTCTARSSYIRDQIGRAKRSVDNGLYAGCWESGTRGPCPPPSTHTLSKVHGDRAVVGLCISACQPFRILRNFPAFEPCRPIPHSIISKYLLRNQTFYNFIE